MSITIKVQPQVIQPVYNETILVLDSDKKTEPKFKFLVDVNIAGVFSSRIPMTTNPQGYAVVDLHKHIEPFITYNIDHDNTSLFSQTPDSFTPYDVTLSESYRIDMNFVSVSNDGGFARYNMGVLSHLEVGDKISVTNSTEASYNGVQTVIFVYAPSQNVVTDKSFVTGATGDAVIFDNSATIVTGTTVMTGNTYAFNASLDWLDVPNWQSSAYTTDHTETLMLTTAPDDYVVTRDDRVWFNFYNAETPTGATVDALRVFTYNASGNQTGNYSVANQFVPSGLDDNRFMNVGVAPWNLINAPTGSTTVTSGTLPIIGSADTSYEVHLLNSTLGRISKSYTFDINDDCTKYEEFRMVYLDKLGSFLNVTFNKASKKKINIKRTSYKQNYGSYNPTTNTWGYDSWDRGKIHLDSDITESIRITSDWVNEDTGNLIVDMIQSPEVYHLNEDGELFAVNIITNSVDPKTRLNDKLINYTLNFEYSFKNGVQRG